MDPVALFQAFTSLPQLAVLGFLVGAVALYWLGNAWILLLSARIFADAEVGWRRSLAAVFVAGLVQSLAGCVLGPLANADGLGVSALEAILASVVSWVVWALTVSMITGLDTKATILTSLGMVGVGAAFGFAVVSGIQLGLA